MGMDDRLVMAEAVKYIESRSSTAEQQPFVAVLIWNNCHRPFLKKAADPSRNRIYENGIDYKRLLFGNGQGEDSAMEALEITDDMTRDLFAALDRAGLRGSTIVTFLSDHGETTEPSSTRLGNPDSVYLATPLWMHVPPPLLEARPGAAAALRRNGRGDRLVTNLDLMPTVVDLLGWAAPEALFANTSTIFGHGTSLLRPLPRDRVASGWQGQPFVDSCDWCVRAC